MNIAVYLKYLSQFLGLFHLYCIVLGRFAAKMGFCYLRGPAISLAVSYVMTLYVGRFAANMGLLGCLSRAYTDPTTSVRIYKSLYWCLSRAARRRVSVPI